MDDLLAGEESAALLHVSQDDGVGLLGLHAGVLAGVVGVTAAVVHGHHHLHAIAAAGLVVVGAEAGSGVDTAGTGVHGDVVGQQQAGGLIQEGVLGQHVLKEGAGMGLGDLPGLKAAHLHDLLHQGLGHDIGLTVGSLHQGVALVGVEGDGQVAGQGPDGGGPDHEVELAVVIGGQLALVVLHLELHVHGGTGIVLVLDLGLGQGGLVVGAPVNGLEALIDIALLVHLPKHLDLLGLKAGVHGLVGVLPVGQHADALEALHLDVDILLGVVVAGGAELGDAHLLAVELLLLDDGALDGHAVVIPAGDIGGVVAPHGVHTGDEVLQGLIEGVAHMQVAVGERRAVVEGEERLTLVLLQHLVVQVHIVPALEHVGLPLGQTGPHGEVGLGEIDGLIVVHVSCSSIY